MANSVSAAPDKLILPAPDDVIRLDPTSREYVLARVLAERTRRKRKNIQTSLELPDPVDWIEANCYDVQTVNTQSDDYSKARMIRLEEFQKRITRHILTINPKTGRFPYRTIVYSAPKKSGKTTFGMCFGTYFAKNVESPNAIYVLANDREQSSGRVFAFSIPTLKQLGAKQGSSKFVYILPNGTVFQALTSDPEKEAGGSYGLTIWDELWAYSSPRARLLFDELMPIATRTNSIRLIVTYAGFLDKSDLLLELYLKVFKTAEELELAPGARPVEGFEDIVTQNAKGEWIPCCYEVPEIGLFYFNDHEQRMTWQKGEAGKALAAETRALLTDTNAYRLMQNRWQMTESPFCPPEIIRRSVNAALTGEPDRPGTFAIDASMKHDTTALVGNVRSKMRYVTTYAKCWVPGGQNIDLEATVIAEVLRLYRAGLILLRNPQPGESRLAIEQKLTCIDVWYDTFQMHQVAMNLQTEYRLLMAPFQQGPLRVLADTFLQRQYMSFNIDIPSNTNLISHLEAAKAESQSEDGKIRIVKGTGTHANPIDLAVAQSMSVYQCSLRNPKAVFGIAQGVAKGW
jgi:phage terminase large subunit-like protein